VLFGPDGLLYLSVGDAAQARLNGQDPANLPGSILRIDVDGGEPYAIPAGNPFGPGGEAPAGLKGAPEVWWFGLRNPWRFSIDEPSGLAFIGDVGQERVEEVNAAPLADGGLNFGWPSFEGTRLYSDVRPVSELTDPIVEVRHSGDGGCSITGGEVYRGGAIPELAGHYFYGDWCRGWIRSFRLADGAVVDRKDWSADFEPETVSSFGHDADGELLVLDWQAGSVLRIVPVRKAP
jgi:glucose/arabinose dehydrogenase